MNATCAWCGKELPAALEAVAVWRYDGPQSDSGTRVKIGLMHPSCWEEYQHGEEQNIVSVEMPKDTRGA